MKHDLPVIAVIGRPNVGKSSLINRILHKRDAIVHDLPGVTRDRKYFDGNWNGKDFKMIDTGGIYTDKINYAGISFQKDIEQQVDVAIAEADVVIFMVDGQEGLHPYDSNIAGLLRPIQDKVIIAVNKVDTNEKHDMILEFYETGLETIMPLSALHGLGVGDLLDKALSMFPTNKKQTLGIPSDAIKVAIVGKPNAGKSSLLNAMLDQDRVIVSSTPGTTRDSIAEEIIREGRHFVFVDTAGIRKKAKVKEDVEYYSVNRALKAIDECDIAVLLIDAEVGMEQQDKKIAQYIQEQGRGCLIAINKWDLIEKDTHTIVEYTNLIESQIPYLRYAPRIFISTKTKQRIPNLYKELIKIYDGFNTRVETPKLNKTLEYIIQGNPPKSFKGKQLKIYYATQIKSKPPTFLLFVNNSKFIQKSYQTYVENKLHDMLNIMGTPLRIVFRNKQKKEREE